MHDHVRSRINVPNSMNFPQLAYATRARVGGA